MHRSPDLAMHRVQPVVGRPAQRHDQDLEAAALERRDLLGDERLGESRIALQNESDAQTQPRSEPMRETLLAGTASSSPRSIHGATSRETFVKPSSNPGTTTSEGRVFRGSARSAAAITAGSKLPSSDSMMTRPISAAREARMCCSRRGAVRGTISARLLNEIASQKVL